MNAIIINCHYLDALYLYNMISLFENKRIGFTFILNLYYNKVKSLVQIIMSKYK